VFITPCHLFCNYRSLGVKKSDMGTGEVARCTKILPKDPVLAEAARALVPRGAAAQGADNIKVDKTDSQICCWTSGLCCGHRYMYVVYML
jgi:hypothetical protein